MMWRRKRPGKIVIAVLFLLGAAALLGGCHGKVQTSSFSAPEHFDTGKDYTITFWAKNDTNKTQVKIYNQAVEDFEKLYPNIHVKLRLYTNYGDIYNDVITNISTGTTPNVCITYPDNIATYMSGENVVVQLDDLAGDQRYGLGGSEVAFTSPTLEEMTPKFLEECRINGRLMAMPFMRSTEACYINQDLVEKLGYEVPDILTWDFVYEVSEAAMEKDEDGLFKVNGQKVLIPFLYKSTDNMLIQMLQQSPTGEYANADGEVLMFNDTTKALLSEVAKHAQSRAFSTFKVSSYPANFLNAGQCIFAVDSTAGSTWMGSEAPLIDISPDKIVKFETAVRPVPQMDPEHPQMISQGPSVCIFNKEDPQEVLASWLFTQFLLTDQVQIPVFNGSASLRDAASYLVEDTVKSARRKQEVNDKYFDQLFQDVKNLYHLDQIRTAGEKDGTDEEGTAPGASSHARDLGPLPVTAVILLAALAAAWAGILVWMIAGSVRNRQKRKGK